MNTAVILGAGFSASAKIPTTLEITNELLSYESNKDIDNYITEILKGFFTDVFHWEAGDEIPSVEDLFTMIDLSANTGYNLGPEYYPKRLRGLRRMLIYRVFQIIDTCFEYTNVIYEFLERYVLLNGDIDTHFIVLNWDIALELHLEKYGDVGIDYCVEATPWKVSGTDDIDRSVALAKVHGSSNWVYCDNCRSLFYDKSMKLSLAIRAGLANTDFKLFGHNFSDDEFDQLLEIRSEDRKCRKCPSNVGPHIATFSYRKSFRTHAFATSWLAAERILTDSNKWMFIGYSLPEADYEFKNLLKTCELKSIKNNNNRKEIIVILKDDEDAEKKYTRFFGSDVTKSYQDGIEGFMRDNQDGTF